MDSSIFNGSIVEDLSSATAKYALVIGNPRKWKLYVKGELLCADYQRIELPDEFVMIDLVRKLLAIRKDCEQKIVPLGCRKPDDVVCPIGPVGPLAGAGFVRKLGTFIPSVGAEPVYPAIPATSTSIAYPAGPTGTQTNILVGKPLTILGSFKPVDRETLLPRELVIISVPSTSVNPPLLTLNTSVIGGSSSTSASLALTPPEGYILGYVTAFVPCTGTCPGSLTIHVLFSTLNIPFISESTLSLLGVILSPILTFLGLGAGLVPPILSLLKGPVLNGQMLDVLGVVALDKDRPALQL